MTTPQSPDIVPHFDLHRMLTDPALAHLPFECYAEPPAVLVSLHFARMGP